MVRILLVVSAAFAVTSAGTQTAAGDPVTDFYHGKQLSFISSASEGGGIATYASAFAPYFASYIPGNPKIFVQTMPGAGGIRAMQYLATIAPKDGTTVALVHSSVSYGPLYGVKGATFDPRQMNWIGSIDSAPALCVSWHTSVVKSWQDMLNEEYLVGASGAGSQMETLPAMLNRLFNTKLRTISGYKGGNEIFLAMERGEISGRCGGGLLTSIKSARPDWFSQKKVVVPIQVTMERTEELPDVPAIGEYAKDERTKRILELILAPQEMDRPMLVPPGVPAERVTALREAFHKAMNDPGFIAEMKHRNLTIKELSGVRVSEILQRAFALPAEIVNDAKEAMRLANVK